MPWQCIRRLCLRPQVLAATFWPLPRAVRPELVRSAARERPIREALRPVALQCRVCAPPSRMTNPSRREWVGSTGGKALGVTQDNRPLAAQTFTSSPPGRKAMSSSANYSAYKQRAAQWIGENKLAGRSSASEATDLGESQCENATTRLDTNHGGRVDLMGYELFSVCRFDFSNPKEGPWSS